MGFWLALIPGPIKRAFSWIAAAVLFIGGAWLAGRREGKQESALEAAERYAKTRKDMDDAAEHIGDDPVVLRDWLRARADK